MPYTYLIGWSTLNTYYYGVRFARNCKPDDLFNPYQTSSKHVKRFLQENGIPDIVQVRRIFDNATEARDWESRVLRRLNVINDSRWLNKTNNKAIDPELALIGARKSKNKGFTPWNKGKPGYKNKPCGPASEEKKAKISKAKKGKPLSEEHKAKMRGPRGPQKNPSQKRRVPWNKGLSGYSRNKYTLKCHLASKCPDRP